MNLVHAIYFAIVLFSLIGLGAALNCSLCNEEPETVCNAKNETIICQEDRCSAIKYENNGTIHFKRGCQGSDRCGNVLELCDRLDPLTQRCLGAGCCGTDLCVPTLTLLPMPSPTTYSSPPQPQTTLKDVATPGISPTTTKPPAFESSTAITTGPTRSTWMDEMTEGISLTSKNQTTLESLVTTRSTRPTCKDSAGMRLVLSPLAIVFVAVWLVACVF